MKINVSWEKLRLFYITAKYESITSAAEQLNLSQPALSRSILFLESRLKITLFHRHARGLALTEKGMVLFKMVEQMMNQVTLAESTLLEMDHVPKGPLSIGASAGIISRLLLNDAQEFIQTYPELELSIVLGDNPPNFAIGEVEAAVFPHISDQDNLVQEYLMSFYMKLFASREYLEKFGIPQSPKDLDSHRLISYGTHPHPFANLNWHLALGCPQGEVRRPYMQVNLGEKIRGLGMQGVGIITLDQKSVEIDPQNNLVLVLPDIKGPKIDFYYIYPKHLENSLRIKALGDYFKMIIKKNGWDSKDDNFKI